MKILVVLAALVVGCLSQTPPRPQISETFQANYEVERHTNVTVFGTGMMARDPALKSAVENSTYENNDREFRLERYDMGKEFTIRSQDQYRCAFRKTTQTTLPSFWEFLQLAKYVGKQEVRHVTYDIWEFHSAGVRISLAVTEKEPNTPVILERETAQALVAHTFSNFQTKVPSSTVFDIPKQCQQA